LGLFGEPRLCGFCFDALLRFDLGGRTSFLGFARCALGLHPRLQRCGFSALDSRLVEAEVRSGAHPEDQDGSRSEQARVHTLALLGTKRCQLTLVIEHARVGLCFFAGFLFEADTQLRFIALACHSLFVIADSPFFGFLGVLFSEKPGRFLLLPLLRFGGDALALGCLASNLLLLFGTNTVFFDAHELAKIEEK
jgi:hypothetical protein